MKDMMHILARIFGKKCIGGDWCDGKPVHLIMYYWRKRYWVWKIKCN